MVAAHDIDSENVNRIMEGLSEVAESETGRVTPARVCVPTVIDVRAIRRRLGLSQEAFCDRFGFKKATVRDWEQKRRRPEAAARVLLTVIDREPEAVTRALEAA